MARSKRALHRKQNPGLDTTMILAILGVGGAAAYYYFNKSKGAETPAADESSPEQLASEAPVQSTPAEKPAEAPASEVVVTAKTPAVKPGTLVKTSPASASPAKSNVKAFTAWNQYPLVKGYRGPDILLGSDPQVESKRRARPDLGYAIVISPKAGASLVVDGGRVSEISVGTDKKKSVYVGMPPGKHTIELKYPGGGGSKKEVTVTAAHYTTLTMGSSDTYNLMNGMSYGVMGDSGRETLGIRTHGRLSPVVSVTPYQKVFDHSPPSATQKLHWAVSEARKAVHSKNFEFALKVMKDIMDAYPGSEQARLAEVEYQHIKSIIAKEKVSGDATKALSLALHAIKEKKYQHALGLLKNIVNIYPGSKEARHAEIQLQHIVRGIAKGKLIEGAK